MIKIALGHVWCDTPLGFPIPALFKKIKNCTGFFLHSLVSCTPSNEKEFFQCQYHPSIQFGALVVGAGSAGKLTN